MKKLPGCLYQLFHGELAPELYDRIIIPSRAWGMVCRDYTFDDKSAIGFNNFGSDIKERIACNNLATGGIYNQNVEGFAETTKQLGGGGRWF